MADRYSEIIELLALDSKTRKELESWRPMWYALRKPDQEAFEGMLKQILGLSDGIESYPITADALILSIILAQQKVIESPAGSTSPPDL